MTRDIRDIILLLILFIALLYALPLEAGEYDEIVSCTMQYKYPGQNENAWKNLITIKKDGLDVDQYLMWRWGQVDLRYYMLVRIDGELRVVISPITVGE